MESLRQFACCRGLGFAFVLTVALEGLLHLVSVGV